MCNSIFVNKISDSDLALDYKVLSQIFDKIKSNSICCAPWETEFPYKPEVHFKITHSDKYLFLHYSVVEEFIRANAIRANENVWEDSCVEFFLSLDNKQSYYNFEFNILGTGLIGYGTSIKTTRNRLSPEQIDRVEVLTQVIKKGSKKYWEIFLIIPKDLLNIQDFSGNTFHANFYKCGDKLPNPHFITWNNIQNPKPNFHLPEYFGELKFQ